MNYNFKIPAAYFKNYLKVFTQGDVCFVLFTLYEKSSYYGDVYPPKNDELSASKYFKIKQKLLEFSTIYLKRIDRCY